MAEVTFAKAFLTTLDKRPIKLPADHTNDPRTHPNQSPYILPRQSHPFPKKTPSEAQVAKAITVTIKPMRAGATVTLSDISLDDSIHDLKTKYAAKISSPVEKIKLLHNKKPAADLKTFKDLGIEGDVEFTAMVMGGAAIDAAPIAGAITSTPGTKIDTAPADKMELDSEAPHPGSEKAQIQTEEASKQGSPSGPGALHTLDFWNDLKGFLTQRLRDETEADKLTAIFKDAWSRQ